MQVIQMCKTLIYQIILLAPFFFFFQVMTLYNVQNDEEQPHPHLYSGGETQQQNWKAHRPGQPKSPKIRQLAKESKKSTAYTCTWFTRIQTFGNRIFVATSTSLSGIPTNSPSLKCYHFILFWKIAHKLLNRANLLGKGHVIALRIRWPGPSLDHEAFTSSSHKPLKFSTGLELKPKKVKPNMHFYAGWTPSGLSQANFVPESSSTQLCSWCLHPGPP